MRESMASNLEAFRVLGLPQVDTHIKRAAATLRAEAALDNAICHARREAAVQRKSEVETEAIVKDTIAHTIERLRRQAPRSPLPIPTFKDRQLIMLITKLCLAPRASHFARCLVPSVAKHAADAMDETIVNVYAALMNRSPDQLSPTTRALITAPTADGGMASTRGCDGGDEASYVAGAMVTDKHIVETSANLASPTDSADTAHLHPLALAALRIKNRSRHLEDSTLTFTEIELRDSIDRVRRHWGERRIDRTPIPSSRRTQPDTPTISCPFTFTNLFRTPPVKRSAIMRGLRAAFINKLLSTTDRPHVVEDLQDKGNSLINAIPCSDRTTIDSDAVATFLRSWYQEPHIDPGAPTRIHFCSPSNARSLNAHSSSHLEVCSRLGGLIQPHNEVVSALRNIIAAAGLAPYNSIYPERQIETPNATSLDDSEVGAPPKHFSDLVFTDSDGSVTHLDVSIVNTAGTTVRQAAAQRHGGGYGCLIQRERTKLRNAQEWIRGSESKDPTSSPEDPTPNVAPSDSNTGASPTSPEMSTEGPDSTDPTLAQSEGQTTTPSPSSPASPTTGGSPQLQEVSADGARRFVPFVLSSSGRLGPRAANFFARLCTQAKRRGHDYTAFGVSGSDDAVAASVREDASWANRNFPAWAKQSISFAVCATKALAIDRILRNDSLAGLTQRGKSAPHRPPGVVGYCPSKHTETHGQD